MQLHKSISRFPIYIFLVLSIWSCRTKKIIPLAHGDHVEIDSVYKQIFSNEDIEWFSAKAKIRIEDSKGSQKAVMYLRMKTDSIIWMVIKKMSVEAARIKISPDSMIILNRFDKSYEANSMTDLIELFGLPADFPILRDFIVGTVPTVDSSKLWKEKLTDKGFTFRSMAGDVVVDMNFDGHTGFLVSGQFYDRFSRTGNWQFSDFRKILGRHYPFKRNYSIDYGDNETMELKIDILELDIDKAYKLRFEIPEHYTKLE